MDALDAVIEIFTWVGFGSAVVLAVAAIVIWAADGTWLPADALVDHEDGVTFVRWFDAEGDANNARAGGADAETLAGLDRASIWYRHGWRDRMRLHRRPAGLRPVVVACLSLLALGVISLVTSWVLIFVR